MTYKALYDWVHVIWNTIPSYTIVPIFTIYERGPSHGSRAYRGPFSEDVREVLLSGYGQAQEFPTKRD